MNSIRLEKIKFAVMMDDTVIQQGALKNRPNAFCSFQFVGK